MLVCLYEVMNRILSTILISSILLLPSAASADEFNPNILIEDARFADTETLGGVEGIQKFLESRGSVLANTDPSFLVKLREPDAALKARLPDPRPNLGRLRTAAELIWDAATSAGLNPQVVLVTLQKEQSLIAGTFSTEAGLQRALDRAMGFGCPDNGTCSDIFLGFYHQLFGNFDSQDERFIGAPASLMRSFNFTLDGVRVGRGPMVDASNNAFGVSPRVRTSRMGDTIVVENTQGQPNDAPATQAVTLSNFATTALYRYTPHVYNGNFNFWRFFSEWFKYPNGTLVKLSGAAETYVVDNGLRRLISSFVINQRLLNASNIITLSPTEFSGLSQGPVMPPLEGTIINDSSGRHFLIEEEKRKLLSSFVAQQRGINLGTAVALPDAEITSYEDGGVALPAEGTLVKSSDNPAVYMITNNEKRFLTLTVFKNRQLSFADVLPAAPGELDQYPTGTPLPPKDGTLVKAQSSPAVYHVGNGLLQPITFFVFQQRGFSFRNVIAVADSELALWEQGKPLPPETGVLTKSITDPTVYYFEGGVRRAVSFDVFQARKFSFKNVLVALDEALSLFERGDDLQLPDRALVKTADNSTVYFLVDGVLRPLTLKAFQNRFFRFEDVVTISAAELAKYPIGAVVEN